MNTTISLPIANVSPIDTEKTNSSSVDKQQIDQRLTGKASSDSRVEQVKQEVDSAYAKVEESNQSDESEALTEAIAVVSDFLNQPVRNVNFQQDEDSGKTVIKVFDVESKELIKQFPSDKVIEMAQKVRSLQMEIGQKTGILIDDQV